MPEKAPPAAPPDPPAASAARPSRVFVSYSRDSVEHEQRVRALADELRELGVDAWIDQYEPYVDHWPSWMAKQCLDANCILVVVTQRYRDLFEGRRNDARGVPFESVLIHNRAYEPAERTARLGVVALSADFAQHIPLLLAGAPRAVWPTQRDAVLRLAWGVSEAEPAPLGPPVPPVTKSTAAGFGATGSSAAPPASPASAGDATANRSREDERLARLQALAAELRSRGADAAEIEAVEAEIRECKRGRLHGHGLRLGDAIGRFVLLRLLGQGGFATVWLARDTPDGGDVALKVLHQPWAGDRTRVQQFERGARRMMALRHEHVVPVVAEPAEVDGYRVFAMRYLPGGDLQSALSKLDGAQRRQVLADVVSALQHAHANGLVHRDVKPSNILLDASQRGYLADFDLVKARDTYAMTRQMGDLFYGAPEVLSQVEGAAETDHRADIYSLAMVVLFTRDAKVLGHGPDAVATSLRTAKVSAREAVVLRRALANDPRQRQESVARFWLELEQAGEDAPVVRRGWWIAVAGVVLLVGLIWAGGILKPPHAPPAALAAEVSPVVPPPAPAPSTATAAAREQLLQLGLKLVEIPASTFDMGSAATEIGRDSDEGPVRAVTVAKFLLARTEVTNAQYRAFVEATKHPEPPYWSGSRFNAPEQPVVGVSWEDATAFCTWAGLRLPTEAEWEYACRAGKTTAFSFGPTITPEQVNYDGNFPYAGAAEGQYRERTVAVGLLPANAWGLHEMHGNVWEWCEDWLGEYAKAPSDGRAQSSDPGSGRRVLRGGSWYDGAGGCRSAYRFGGHPGGRDSGVGFRPASSPP